MSALGVLAVFSALSLNMMLQFGLGIGGLTAWFSAQDEAQLSGKQNTQERVSLFEWIILFLSVLILWPFFTYVLMVPAFGFLESFLLFPATMMVSTGLEWFFAYLLHHVKIIPGNIALLFRNDPKLFSSFSSYNGLTLAALLLTLRLAVSLVEALVLALGFSLGCLAAVLILREIRRRSILEATPQALRGAPLLLISMGLLSLIFSSVSVILLKVLGVF